MNDTHFGTKTGAPIPKNLSVGMDLCEELHLIGNGCKYDDICEFDSYYKGCGCALEKHIEDGL